MRGDSDAYLERLKARAGSLIADNALSFAPRPEEVGGPSTDDGPFQVSLNAFQKGLILGGMRATGADKGFDRTIKGMTGGAFTPEQVKALEDRALNKASWDEAMALRGVAEGPPVMLDRKQKTIVDGLMGRLGSDPLATDARAAYQGALNAGQIRVR